MSETATLTLTDFLLARIAEDEGYAHYLRNVGVTGPQYGTINEALEAVVARVLADCESKRRIVEFLRSDPAMPVDSGRFVSAGVLTLLAHPYADHPDYRSEWR